MNNSMFLSPTELTSLVDERIPGMFPPLSPEELDFAELVSKSPNLTERYYALHQTLTRFLAEVDRLLLEAAAQREGAGK